MQIPMEDNFEDIIGKAQRGLGFSDEDLSFRAGISVRVLRDIKSGSVLEGPARLQHGCYEDQLVREAGRWQFAERSFTVLSTQPF